MSDTNETLRKVLLHARGPVEMTSRYIRRRTVDGWDRHEWVCTLHCFGRTHVTPYYLGMAHTADEPPTLNDVLERLLCDAASVTEGFDAWCEDTGHDTDSRKAMATFRACLATRRGLQELFGAEVYDRLEAGEGGV